MLDLNSFEQFVVAILFAILVVVGMGFLLAYLNRKHKDNQRIKSFIDIFGISPTTIENRTPGEQSIIDRALEIRAKIFFEKTEAKGKLEEYVKSQRESGVITEDQLYHAIISNPHKYIPLNAIMTMSGRNVSEIISCVRNEIEDSKQNFWKSHGLAGCYNYITHEKIGDYKLFQI